jgi:hypothetical protein
MKLLLAINFYPFETEEFPKCAELILLQAFGANVSDHDFDRTAAYRFLFKTYAVADRNHPFASIPRDADGTTSCSP